MDDQRILVLNAGSSSLKFAVYDRGSQPTPLYVGAVERIGHGGSTLTLRENGIEAKQAPIDAPNHASCLSPIFQTLADASGVDRFVAVGHRIVHGGPLYSTSQIVSPEVVAELKRIVPLAAEHLPAEVALIESIKARFPELMQAVCFDTTFHRDLPRVAKLLPIPRKYEAAGIRRYGFHGLSYEYLMQRIRDSLGEAASRGRVVLAHLGNGASMAAVYAGRCMDTSMAFTPTAGLVMGTRSGDLDPGLLAYLLRSEHLTSQQLEDLINHRSGLLGISETSSDMRDLLNREKSDVRAAEAVELFCYQAKKQLGAYAAAMNGLDLLIFAGGIGEKASSIRSRICAGLDYIGLQLDDSRNRANADVISTASSQVVVMIVKTDEEAVIAKETYRLLNSNAEHSGPNP